VGLLKQMGCKYVSIYFHDTDCYHHEIYTVKTINKVKVRRGGTSHVDVFQQIEDNETNIGLVVAFTDLETRFPDMEPKYPVLWVHSPGCTIDPPWGRKVKMELS